MIQKNPKTKVFHFSLIADNINMLKQINNQNITNNLVDIIKMTIISGKNENMVQTIDNFKEHPEFMSEFFSVSLI